MKHVHKLHPFWGVFWYPGNGLIIGLGGISYQFGVSK
jgi:hypothetical protein